MSSEIVISVGVSSSRRRISRDHEADHQPDRDPAGGRAHELEPRVERREAPAHRGGHGHPVGHERGRVVHEALALDDVHEPARGAELAHDRRGGHRIGRRDDGAEREGQRPREPDHLVRRSRRRPRSSRAPGRSPRCEIARRSLRSARRSREERRRVEQRRQEDQQDQVGLELDVRDARHEPEHQPTEHERDRVRHRQPARDRRSGPRPRRTARPGRSRSAPLRRHSSWRPAGRPARGPTGPASP